MGPYQAHFLGGFRFEHHGTPLQRIESTRLQSLFAYLVLHQNGLIPKSQLAFLFWPDSDEQQARTNLRGLLFRLQQAWPDFREYVSAGDTHLRWQPDHPIALDVTEFQHMLAVGRQSTSLAEKKRLFQEAAALYQGDLLPTCYEDWIIPIREELHTSFFSLLEELIAILETDREYAAALAYAGRMCAFDPLHEPAYQHLMRLNALNGNRAAAVQVFQLCEATLRRELNVDPDPTTQALYAQISANKPYEAQPESKRQPLVGRALEWREIQRAWQLLKTGAHFLVLNGEAGIGKTALAEEFARWVRDLGGQAAIARCYAGEGTIAYAPLVGWLRERIRTPGHSEFAPLWLREVARIVPNILLDYPDIPAPDALTENWQRRQFYEALARVILPERGKLLLVIDDIQWCDEETLEWLRFLRHFDPARPVLVIATCRVEESFEARPLETLLQQLAAEGMLTQIDLAGLDQESVVSLAAQILNRNLDGETTLQLYRETEGNPLFVVEIARAWLQGSRSLPRKVLGVIETRLALLSAPAHEIIEQAAVLERDFSSRILIEAGGLAEDQVVKCLDELLRRRLILERGEEGYDFIHAKVREVAYQQLSSARRQMLHRRAAEAIVRVFSAPEVSVQVLDTRAAQVGAHFEAARSPYQAFQYYARAADYSARIFAHRQAELLYQQAIQSARKINWSGTEIARLFAARGRMLEHLGQFQSAVEVYAELERLAEEHEDPKMQCIALERMVSCYVEPSLVHSIEKANPLLEKGLAIARAIGDHEQEAKLLWCRMMKATHYGQPEEAEEAGDLCIAVARANDFNDLLAIGLHDLALNLRLNGNLAKAEACAAEAGRLFKKHGNLNLYADFLNQRAVNSYNQLDLDAALQTAEEAAALSSRLDNKWNLAYAFWIQAMVQHALGNRELAIPLWEKSMAVGQEASFLMSLTTVKLQLGDELRRMGQTKRALQLHREACETSGSLAPFMLIPSEAQLAMDYMALGDWPAAGQMLQSALARRPLGSIGSGFCLPDLSRAQVEWACHTGEQQGALESVQAAVEEAQRRNLQYFALRLRLEQGRLLRGMGRQDEAKTLWGELVEQAKTARAGFLLQEAGSALAQIDGG